MPESTYDYDSSLRDSETPTVAAGISPVVRDPSTATRPSWHGKAILVSFILVVAARLLLVVGLIETNGLVVIYVSIGMSGFAALLLVIAVLRSRRRSGAE